MRVSKTKDRSSDRRHSVTYNRYPKSVVADKGDLNKYGDSCKYHDGRGKNKPGMVPSVAG